MVLTKAPVAWLAPLVALLVAFSLAAPGHAQAGRPTLVVAPINHDQGALSSPLPAGFTPDTLRREIEAALAATRLFIVPPRDAAAADAILNELVRSDRRPRKAIMADYVVAATITELRVVEQLRVVPHMKSHDFVSVRGRLMMDVRLLSPVSQETVSRFPVEVNYAPSGVMVNAFVSRNNTDVNRPPEERSPQSPDAFVALARLAGALLAERALEQLNAVQVVAREGDRVFVNRGSDSGYRLGQVLRILSRGREIKDPITGEVIGNTGGEVGKIELVDVRPRLSIGKILEETQPIAEEMLVSREIVSPPPR